MVSVIVVALGGAVGATARFALSGWLLYLHPGASFPWATCAVNILGCFIAGLISGLNERYQFMTPEMRLLLFTGLLGGFTTFSAFGIETVALLKRGEWTVAALYITASVMIGCGGVALGVWCTRGSSMG